MNWYKQYKKAMALPEVKNQYPYSMDYGLKHFDKQLTEEKAKELSEPQMEYLNSGFYGSVYGFEGKNIVKKFTRDSRELRNATEIISRQNGDQPLPGLVYVYEVKDLSADIFDYVESKKDSEYLPHDINRLYQITSEKVSPLSDEQQTFFEFNYDVISAIMDETPTLSDEDILSLRISQRAKIGKDELDFIRMIISLVRTMIDNGYLRADMHKGNVGIRDNREMVILDLGAMDFKND